MKKLMMMVAVMVVMMGCEKPIIESDAIVNDGVSSGTNDSEAVKNGKNFTFTVKGDFSTEWKSVTRGYLAADGKDMTDLWVMDYMNGELVQQVHQVATDENFGKPAMRLAYGSHHVYFVASRGAAPTMNVGEQSIVWEKPSDTFWKDYEVEVVSTSNGNRAVTLDRVATKLKLTVTDEVPAECAEVAVTPGAWYYGLDYVRGVAIKSQQTERVIEVPANYIGTAGQLAVTIFGMSGSEEWSTSVTIEGRDADGGVLGLATMNDVPFKRNRVTEYSGPLFGSHGDMVLTLGSEWEEAVTGTW